MPEPVRIRYYYTQIVNESPTRTTRQPLHFLAMMPAVYQPFLLTIRISFRAGIDTYLVKFKTCDSCAPVTTGHWHWGPPVHRAPAVSFKRWNSCAPGNLRHSIRQAFRPVRLETVGVSVVASDTFGPALSTFNMSAVTVTVSQSDIFPRILEFWQISSKYFRSADDSMENRRYNNRTRNGRDFDEFFKRPAVTSSLAPGMQ